jgi:hypothetical protein
VENRDLNPESSIGPVAQWIRHRPTEPGIAGSSPAGVNLLVDAKCQPLLAMSPCMARDRVQCSNPEDYGGPRSRAAFGLEASAAVLPGPTGQGAACLLP